MHKIATLSHEEEIKLLWKAKKGKTKNEREKAIRSLIYYNQSFVKYLVRGVYYPQNEMSAEDLVNEGSIALIEVIKNFDLSEAKKYRFATYAGYWVRQRIQNLIKRNQIFSQPPKIKIPEQDGDDRDETSKQRKTWGIIYYDQVYQDSEKSDKMISLLDTLVDEDESTEMQIQQRDIKNQVNNLLSGLDVKDNLLIRLSFGIAPLSLSQLYPLASEEKKKELKKLMKSGGKTKENFFSNQRNNHLVQKYLEILSVPRKKEEVAQLINKLEFWEYFTSFTQGSGEITWRRSSQSRLKTRLLNFETEKSKWLAEGANEKDVVIWMKLGYQPADFTNPQNHIFKNIGISKKERDQWEKSSTKHTNSLEAATQQQKDKKRSGSRTRNTTVKEGKWPEPQLAKIIESWKKNILARLKEIKEQKA